jgi:hypothetical protein
VDDHTDSSVSEVTSEARDAGTAVSLPDVSGDAGTAVSPPDVSGDAGTAVSLPDVSVDAAVNRLGELDSTDVSEHPAIYEDIHRSLASALDATPTTQADQ